MVMARRFSSPNHDRFGWCWCVSDWRGDHHVWLTLFLAPGANRRGLKIVRIKETQLDFVFGVSVIARPSKRRDGLYHRAITNF